MALCHPAKFPIQTMYTKDSDSTVSGHIDHAAYNEDPCKLYHCKLYHAKDKQITSGER